MQYGVNPLGYGSTGSNLLITTLTFQVISGGDGTAEVLAFLGNDDIIAGGVWGPTSAESTYTYQPSDYAMIGTSIAIVPEPTTAFSLALGLGWLACRRFRP